MIQQNADRTLQELMDALAARGRRPRLLLHCCCAPCSTAVIERLAKAFDMVLYYYNPNIDTREEHDLRARELLRLAEQSGLPGQAVAVPYDPAAWLEAVRGLEREREGGRRCEKCFALRLRQSARYAAAQGFDYFTTTLSISPLKSAALLNRLGMRIGQEEGVAFLQADFKKRGGFLRSTQLSKQYGIYRQDYCGCAFSKRERDARRGQDQ